MNAVGHNLMYRKASTFSKIESNPFITTSVNVTPRL
jgi:hypothetical protein